MKHKNILAVCALLVALPALVLASDVIDEDVNEDLYFPNGVKIEGVEQPDGDKAVDSSSVTIEGAGSVTIGTQSGGGFPRLSVTGGTNITSTRDWTSESNRSWWDGQFSAPLKTLKPKDEDITNAGFGKSLTATDAYMWGLGNETFSYRPKARVALPTEEKDNQTLFVAYLQADGSWKKTDTMCIVSNNLCVFEVDYVSSLALVKYDYNSCPVESVDNGIVGDAPNCVIACDKGYKLNCFANQCVPENCSGDDCQCGDSVGVSGDGNSYGQVDEYLDAVRTVEEMQIKPGYFMYRGSNKDRTQVLDTEGLTGDDLQKVEKINRGALSRGFHEDRELNDELAEEIDNSSFLDYLLNARTQFGEGENANIYSTVKEGASEEVVMDSEEEVMYAAAPLLPSTGPSVFIIIAVIGLGLMVLGSIKRT